MADSDRDLLRIAMAMNGGVSLAVWMGGVAAEILELVRSPGPTESLERNKYAALTHTLRYEPQVDIISGTSAGGLNGVILAYAMANGIRSLDGLRQIWFEQGDFAQLLRDVDEADPRSLLQGDAVFKKSIEQGLKDLVDPKSPRTDPVDWPISLFVTSTLLDGEHRQLPDDFGEQINDTDHQLLFRFLYAPGDPNGVFDGTEKVNRQRLAKAARSSASFPGAFEPSLVEVGEGAKPDMTGVIAPHDMLDASAWMIDGGVLMNRPIKPAIDAIFNQPTEKAVRRVLAYVHPDPGSPEKRKAADPKESPPLSTVISRAVVTIPRQESISTEIKRLRDHNETVRSQREAKDALTLRFPTSELVATARALVPAYRAVRCARSVTRTMDTIYEAASDLNADTDDRSWVPAADDLRYALMRGRLSVLPGQDDEDPRRRFFPEERFLVPVMGDLYWQYGIRTAQRIVGTVIDLIRRFTEASPLPPVSRAEDTEPGDERTEVDVFAQHRNDLDNLTERAHQLLADIERSRKQDTGHWASATKTLKAKGGDELTDWATESYRRWGEYTQSDKSTGQLLGEIGRAARSSAYVLKELRQLIDCIEKDLTDIRPNYFAVDAEDEAQESRWRVVEVVRSLADGSSENEILKRLLALEVIQLVGGQEEVLPQEVELIQFSALAEQHLVNSGPSNPAEKLTGVELGHFGAFLKRSWRANDWMWGRLDAANRIVSLLVEPKRLRQLYAPNDTANEDLLDAQVELLIAHLRTAATQSDDPEMAEWLAKQWETHAANIVSELSALLAGTSTKLTITRAAVVRALQVEVLRYELPQVFRAIAADKKAKSSVDASTAFRSAFADAVRDPNESPCFVKPDRAESLITSAFGQYEVGSETVAEEAASDRGVQTAVHAAVVSTGAVGGEKPLKSIIPPVRGALLWVHRLYRFFTPDTGLARTARFITFAVAGALVATSFISGDVSPLISAVGLAVLFIAFLLGLTPQPKLLLWSLGFVALAFLVWNAGTLRGMPPWGVAIAIVAALLFGLAIRVWKWSVGGAVLQFGAIAVLVALTLTAVATIEPLREWVADSPTAAATTEEPSAQLEGVGGATGEAVDEGEQVGGATDEAVDEGEQQPTRIGAALDWVERHRIEVIVVLLVVGFSGIGTYRAADLERTRKRRRRPKPKPIDREAFVEQLRQKAPDGTFVAQVAAVADTTNRAFATGSGGTAMNHLNWAEDVWDVGTREVRRALALHYVGNLNRDNGLAAEMLETRLVDAQQLHGELTAKG